MIEHLSEAIPVYIEQSGILAPILFILFHLIRPLLFLPVLFVCMVGGYLFGVFYGSVFSIIGLTLMCIIFYFIAQKFPNVLSRFAKMNQKMLKNGPLTMNQIMVLRLVPFAHFHLLSLYVMEQTSSFKEYTKYSFLGVILPGIIFTSFGQLLIDLPLFYSGILLLFLCIIFFGVKRRGFEKQTSIQWKKFFKASS
ncbi:TVP38/TMEM64 family protein [Anaerobacillus alkaliphilus]|uniref:TVP38/TMEM64 family protein n=1 Tax=Anaerobacillus alkaliphilus TaxID=1548597 RepID=A0A4Q0VQU9_9BACI|nr:VTT domain-containing protein [Anaerobacillus alkaliphilus]RXI98501.1 TVP38/TMEM64 family protein [Anaerobacillus alkaliphilus]